MSLKGALARTATTASPFKFEKPKPEADRSVSPPSRTGPSEALKKALRHGGSTGFAIAAGGSAATTYSSAPSTSEPSMRGRQVIFTKMQQPSYGVSSPRSSALSLQGVEQKGRLDAQSIIAACRARGQKFTDTSFYPGKAALFIDGESSSQGPAASQIEWKRVADLIPNSAKSQLVVDNESLFMTENLDNAAFISAVAMLRAAQRPPTDLIVMHDFEIGVVVCRVFKDGEWVHEVIDDFLPCTGGSLACGATTTPEEVWIALIAKANAKIHGSYEAVRRGTELEALEDLTHLPVRRLDRNDFGTGKALWYFLQARQEEGCIHTFVRRGKRRGEEQTSGLLAGYGYPLTGFEESSGELLCQLDNPWTRGGWRGRSGMQAGAFWMSAEEAWENFTDVYEVRILSDYWLYSTVTLSTDRPSYPLLSVNQEVQCELVASQADRRWNRQDGYLNGIGLRIYRCRIIPLSPGQAGVRQNPNANPFEGMELIQKRPLSKTHSVSAEILLEPSCLYVLSTDSQYRCARCVLRFACSGDVQLRELSAPEAAHFLEVQGAAPNAEDMTTFPRSLTECTESTEADWSGAHIMPALVRKCIEIKSFFSTGC